MNPIISRASRIVQGQPLLKGLLVFPIAALFSSFSMTGMLLLFGLAGHAHTAADIGLVQAATLALFFAFSANARNLVLGDPSGRAARDLLHLRCLLMLPLAGAAWILSAWVGNASPLLAMVLILRKLCEWFSEIGLAVHERRAEPGYATQYLAVELLTLAIACIPLFNHANLDVYLIPWSLAPLASVGHLRLGKESAAKLHWRMLLPHFGSTAAIGISTYVFRISLALLAGKTLAGELFTAFAIGGLLPTVFGQALAPTLSVKFRNRRWPRRLLLLPLTLIFVAAGLALAVHLFPTPFAASPHPPLFWRATGLSIAGGALMSVALVVRTRLIQNMQGAQVYGPDVLANVIIATSVPFVYSLFGDGALSALYLFSAGLNLAFFWGARSGLATRGIRLHFSLTTIGFVLVVPVFVQICCGLFHDPDMVFNSNGDITRLPLPLSIASVFIGIAALGNYASAIRTLTTVFFTAVLFVMTSLMVASGDHARESAKLILLAQFLLPLFGLVLGEMFAAASAKPMFERAAAVMLVLVLPAQMLSTWMHGYVMAHPQVGLFSIYQHLQYFPMVVAASAVMACMSLWNAGPGWRLTVMFLWPLVILHQVASLSIGGLLAVLSGLLCFSFVHGRRPESRRQVVLLAGFSLALGLAYGALWHTGTASEWLQQPNRDTTGEMRWVDKLPLNAKPASDHPELTSPPRDVLWSKYAEGASESVSTFLLGHATQPDRRLFPSAHNYWLDALYNFGALSVLPLLALLAMIVRMAWQRRRLLLADPVLLGTTLACAYLTLGENMVKVGMRQPYSGLITFFLLGLLISRLRALPAAVPDHCQPNKSAPPH